MTLKEKWESYESHIKDLRSLKEILREKKYDCEYNIDYLRTNNKYVKAYLDGQEIETIKSSEEFEQFMGEGACYVTDCVVDKFFEINGYESDDEEEQDEQRNWTFETLWYNVVQMYCDASFEAIDELIEDVNSQQWADCIEGYEAEYENAKDYLYYGLGYDDWYDNESFESEEDAKFIWHVAFEAMANAD